MAASDSCVNINGDPHPYFCLTDKSNYCLWITPRWGENYQERESNAKSKKKLPVNFQKDLILEH